MDAGISPAPYTAAGPFSWSVFLTTDRLRRAATDYSARYREEQQAIPAIRKTRGRGPTAPENTDECSIQVLMDQIHGPKRALDVCR